MFTVNAGPTITAPTSGSPFTLGHGSSSNMTITGTGFSGTLTVASITASGGHFTINSIVSQNATTIVVNVTAVSSSKGTSDLTVTNPDGGTATAAGSMVNS